ncbi:acyl-CoA thioesterase [Octadecabacter sp. CECT 8868]|uniref:acyl-CoA thioesterase n=1 Tax=Octadecabacter algicola TaxID=2909342 RepID=UPI001F275807|nr:thioesterase family protein [Octadecabacter algicola]MCF2903867.1 acyl-CoA thioesterase [Octadecabacter algicola]
MTTPYLTPLGPTELRDAGVPAPWAFGMADRVRFGEIDALNHVNNVAYLRWYETLRVHYLDHYDIYNLAGDKPKFVVKSVGLDYKAEVKRGASYINVTRTVALRNTSFTMEYATFVEGQITTTGTCVAVLLNFDNTKRALPDALRDALMTRDGAVQA